MSCPSPGNGSAALSASTPAAHAISSTRSPPKASKSPFDRPSPQCAKPCVEVQASKEAFTPRISLVVLLPKGIKNVSLYGEQPSHAKGRDCGPAEHRRVHHHPNFSRSSGRRSADRRAVQSGRKYRQAGCLLALLF